MPVLKYAQKKTPTIESKAATEVRRLLNRQNPPLGYADAAAMIGVHAETMRSVVNDERVPSAGIINGLARALDLNSREVTKLFDLFKEDKIRAKLKKATEGAEHNGESGFADLYSTLTDEQREVLLRSALRFAKGNEKGEEVVGAPHGLCILCGAATIDVVSGTGSGRFCNPLKTNDLGARSGRLTQR